MTQKGTGDRPTETRTPGRPAKERTGKKITGPGGPVSKKDGGRGGDT